MAADLFVATLASKGAHRSAHRVRILSLIASKIVHDGGVKVLAKSCLIRIKAKPRRHTRLQNESALPKGSCWQKRRRRHRPKSVSSFQYRGPEE